MKKSVKLRNLAYFIGISIFGVVAVILFGVVFSNFLSLFNFRNLQLQQILLTWTAMIMGLCVTPYLLVKILYNPSITELGIGKIKKNELFGIILISFLTIVYLLLNRTNLNFFIFFVAIMQNLGVAISEEFFSKGILFYIAKNITAMKMLAIVMCALVFAFFFHSGDLFITNLTYRLPMGIILGIIYFKTENIYLPITLHIANNLIATSIFK